MSQIIFNAIDGKAKVNGSENKRMGSIIGSLAFSLIENDIQYNRGLDKMFKIGRDHWIEKVIRDIRAFDYATNEQVDMVKTAIFPLSDAENLKIWDDLTNNYQNLLVWNLNQALRVGNDVIRFCARIFGQVEIHCWVKEENYPWFSNIIKDGLRIKILSEDAGWQDVLDLLKKTKSKTVVLSYSVTDSFPSADIVDMDYEDFYNLSEETQWNLCFMELDRKYGPSLEMKPENWDDYWFGEKEENT